MHRLIHAPRCDEKGAVLVEYGVICVAAVPSRNRGQQRIQCNRVPAVRALIPTRPTYVPRGSAAYRAPVGTISVGTSSST